MVKIAYHIFTNAVKNNYQNLHFVTLQEAAMKRMRQLCLILAAALVAAFPATAAEHPVSIRASVPLIQPQQGVSIPVAAGETLELSAAEIELRLGMEQGRLTGLTITGLPAPANGLFFLDGVEVEAFDTLTRDEVDRLCFVPVETVSAASMTFMPIGGTAAASLHINVLAQPNQPPEAESLSVDTLKNVSITGYVNVIDPEEESVSILVTRPPSLGEVRFSGQSFTYTPYKNTSGKDRFSIRAVDACGNYSAEATVTVNIEGGKSLFTYADMAGHPSLYAAVKLRERGIMSGVQIGEKWFFSPNDQLDRGRFLVMVLVSAGLETKPTVNTGLPNDGAIPQWLKPYVKKAAEEGIISSTQPFQHKEIPIRAEAVLMVDRAAKIKDVKSFPLSMPDRNTIPEWAQKSYMDLAAYKMLDLHDGCAYPSGALTNSYGADLIWQLYKHVYR